MNYDANRLPAEIIRNGQKTAIAYNDNGQMISQVTCIDGENNENQTHYNLGFLTEHTHNDTEYEYSYYNTGKIKSVSIAGKLLANYEYSLEDFAEVNQKYGTIAQPINAATEYFSVEKVTLASGEQFVNVFEPKGKLVKRLVSKNGGAFEVLLENGYDEYDNFVASIDKASGEMYNESVGYDIKGRVQTTTVGNVNVGYTYNDNNQLQTEQVELAGNVVDYQYTYEDTPNARLKAVVVNGKENNVEYDCLGRVASLSNDVFGKKLSYLTNGERTTKLVSKVTYNKNGKTDGHIRYTYDKMGNIERVIENGFEVVRYWYDGVNRLVREDNKSFDETYTYLYDKGGNILQKSVYNYENAENLIALPIRTFDYVYRTNGWNDQLLEWNGKAFEYDSLGNPTTYRDKALVWKNGRQLASFDSVNFTYLSNGTRRTKTTNGGTKTFHYVGEKLIGESTITYDILFHYGLEGVSGFDYVDKSTGIKQEFTYRKNIQGDITAIYNSNNELVTKYVYDAWGNHKIFAIVENQEVEIFDSIESVVATGYENHIGVINSIRYRGYYFDSETSLYYLMSRYYDPILGRFITADSIEYLDPESINGLNLYVYCLNNPVMLEDPTGTMPNWLKWLIGGVVIIALGIAAIATGGAAAGVAGFIVAGAFKGAVIGAVSGALVSGTIGGITSSISGKGFWNGFANGAANGFMSGAIIGGVTGAISSGAQVANAAKYWDKGTYRSAFRSMQDHYQRKIVQQGLNKGYNIVKYTQDAVGFVNRNARILSLVPNYKGLQHAWTLNTKYFGYGWNGLFTATGKIITFGIW